MTIETIIPRPGEVRPDKPYRTPRSSVGRSYGDDGSCEATYRMPIINWKHVDGPLMYLSNGQLHWLTWLERFQLAIRWVDVTELDEKIQHSHRRNQ